MIQKTKVKQYINEQGKMATPAAIAAIDARVRELIRSACRNAGRFKKLTAEDVFYATLKSGGNS